MKSVVTTAFFTFFTFFTLIFFTRLSAQSALITSAERTAIIGVVLDAKTKEPAIGATILLVGTSNGAATDLDGKFELTNVPIGSQKIIVSYTGYQDQEIVVETMSSIAKVVNVSMMPTPVEIKEVVTVTAARRTNTELSVLAETRKVEQIAVGVSAAQIAKTQDRDASAVIKRVPGVSVTDDKFVNIRGLSERYNTVLLNDVLTPSTEVDGRAFAFDLIPSTAIDRMLVFKTGAAELPAEFAGGIIKIYTKTSTDENSVTAGISTGIRAGTTFQQAAKYAGSSTDVLGFDNGLRTALNKLPSAAVLGNDRNIANEYYSKLPAYFNLSNTTINPDLRANIGYNHNWLFGKKRLSTVTALSYSNANVLPMNAYQERYQGTQNDELQQHWTDQTLQNSVRIGAMSNWAYFFNPYNKITFNTLYNQIATDNTTVRTGVNDLDGIEYKKYGFRYEAKSIVTSQLGGSHEFSDRQKLTWTLGYSYTNRNEPDYRQFSMSRSVSSEPYTIDIPASGSPSLNLGGRYFSELSENVATTAVNYEQKIGKDEGKEPVKLRAGIYSEAKSRLVNARWFGYINPTAQPLAGYTPETFFAPSNIGSSTGISMYEGTNADDKYTAQNLLVAPYLGITVPFSSKFKASAGIRAEYNNQQLQSKKRGGGAPINVVTPVLTPLPSLNLSYQLNEKNALRLAYSYSINRPEFREISPLQYYDFGLELSKIGNPDLKTATIHNIDARYEIYPQDGEMITFAAFYKHFTNPIEMTGKAAGSGTAFFFDNPLSAQSAGLEVEVRKQINKEFTVVGNASYIYSEVDASNIPGQVGKRPLQGQSPYLVNTGLYYAKNGWQANILYNIIGERILSVGDNLGNQTVFELPRHQLDLNLSKTIGKNIEAKLGIGDVLNQAFRWTTDTNVNGKADAADKLWRTYQRGTYTTLGINFRF